MLRSMFAAVSGLRAHQTMMDVVGNNIANVNTTGFKSSPRHVPGGAEPDPPRRGRRRTPRRRGPTRCRSGSASQIASIDGIFTQGATQMTGRTGDLAIQGDGFFVVARGRRDLLHPCRRLQLRRGRATSPPPAALVLQGWMADRDRRHQHQRADRRDPAPDRPDHRAPADREHRARRQPAGAGRRSATRSTRRSPSTTLRAWRHDVALRPAPDVAADAVDRRRYSDRRTVARHRRRRPAAVDLRRRPARIVGHRRRPCSATSPVAAGRPRPRPRRRQRDQPVRRRADRRGASARTARPWASCAASRSAPTAPSPAGSPTARPRSSGRWRSPRSTTRPVCCARATRPFTRLGRTPVSRIIGAAGRRRRGQRSRRGSLEMSNVDLAAEFTNLIIAQRGFQANSRGHHRQRRAAPGAGQPQALIDAPPRCPRPGPTGRGQRVKDSHCTCRHGAR